MNRRTFMKTVAAAVVSTALPTPASAPSWLNGNMEWLERTLETLSVYNGPPEIIHITPTGWSAMKTLALRSHGDRMHRAYLRLPEETP